MEYLRETVGIKQAGYRDTITVRAPDDERDRVLPASGRRPGLRGRDSAGPRIDDGRPVRLTVSVYPADRNQFSVVVGQVPDNARVPDSPPSPAAASESGGG